MWCSWCWKKGGKGERDWRSEQGRERVARTYGITRQTRDRSFRAQSIIHIHDDHLLTHRRYRFGFLVFLLLLRFLFPVFVSIPARSVHGLRRPCSWLRRIAVSVATVGASIFDSVTFVSSGLLFPFEAAAAAFCGTGTGAVLGVIAVAGRRGG